MKLDNFIEENGFIWAHGFGGSRSAAASESWVMQDCHMVKCREHACRFSPLSS